MELSIITICYNIEGEIERTCESIVNQTCQNFEWLVIDGGSTDGTLEILNKYKDRINIFVSERDDGVYNAMNKGIERASGKFINFMNGGDVFYDNLVLENVLPTFVSNSDIYYGDVTIDGYFEDRPLVKYFPENLAQNFFIDECLGHQASFIKKSLFDTYGLYNEKLRIVSDWEKWIVFIFNNCKFEHVDVMASMHYFNGLSSMKDTKQYNLQLVERNEVYKTYYPHLAVHGEGEQKTINLLGIPFIKKMTYYTSTKYMLFNFLPVLEIKSSHHNTKKKIFLFGFLPLLKLVGECK